TTDPDRRSKRHNKGGCKPSYNVHLTTEARQIVIVSVDVTQAGNDAEQLQPAMQRVQQESGQAPQQAIADGSYTHRGNIVAMDRSHIDLIGPPPDHTTRKGTLYQIRGVAPAF